MSAGKKILVGGISTVLLVAIVIGVVATVTSHNRSESDDYQMPNNANGLTSTSKSVDFFCQGTDYKQACQQSLKSALGGKDTVPLKDIVAASVNVTVDTIKAALENSKDAGKGNTTDKLNQGALSDCQSLLQFAIDELQDALSVVGDDNILDNLPKRVDDIKTWLSAVISYQETCLDQITNQELKSAMQNGLLNSSQLSSNALAIFSKFVGSFQDLQDFSLPANLSSAISGTKRRLLAEEEDTAAQSGDAEVYPSWLSAGDRKLMAAHAQGAVKPNVVVAQDGSGNFKTITEALNAMPKKTSGRYVIYVKAGIYREYVNVDKDMANVFMYGDGPRKTIVTGNKCNRDGVSTFQSATFAAVGTGFIAKSMGFTNTAGPEGHQAVALRVQSDMSAFFNCRMDGYQDTLYAQTHRQFYRNCVISGTVDFIFGDSAVVLQNCLIIVRLPMDNQQNTVTAQGRKDKRETTGIVIHNCRIVPETKLFADRFKIPSYLGRPWKEYSRTIIMESTLGDFIRPEGWMPWDGNLYLNTLYYAEYMNRGPGAKSNRRVRWPGVKMITDRRVAQQYTVGSFIQGNQWLPATGGTYLLGLRY